MKTHIFRSLLLAVVLFACLTPAFGYEVAAFVGGVSFVGSGILFKANFSMPGALMNIGIAVPKKAGLADSGRVGIIHTNPDRANLEGLYGGMTDDQKNRLQPHTLVLEAEIKNTDSVLTFKHYDTGTGTFAPEIVLERNDKIFVTHIALGIVRYNRTTQNTDAVPEFYPNDFAFGTTAAAFLQSIYQTGRLSVSIGNAEKIKGLHCMNFMTVPDVQRTAATNLSRYEWDKVFYALNPMLILDGSGTNEILVRYKTYAGWAGGTAVGSGNGHYARLYLRGYLLVNGSANT